jgi:glycosyltransferase involved in cell wall biosynthesis
MPVYNEEGCVADVCREWLAEASLRGHFVLVVDDGSRDRTAAILDELARSHPGLIVVRQANAGHGAAVVRGYREALARGAEWVFQVDSDGQHCASDFGKLWEKRDSSACLLGFRETRHDPLFRRWFSSVHRGLMQLFFGRSPMDPNVPFRLMRSDLLARMLDALPPGAFAPNVWIGLLGMRAGQDPLNIPIRHLARKTGASTLRIMPLARAAVVHLRDMFRFRSHGFREFGA